MSNLSDYIERFKNSDEHSDRICAELIFAELIVLASQRQILQPLGELKSGREKPLSFFLIDELASKAAKNNINLIIGSINLYELNSEQKNCFHYLLTLRAGSSEPVELAMKWIMLSKVKLDISRILLQTTQLSFGSKLNVLEYAAFMKCWSGINAFLNILKTDYISEIKSILDIKGLDNVLLSDKLISQGVDRHVLNQFRFVSK